MAVPIAVSILMRNTAEYRKPIPIVFEIAISLRSLLFNGFTFHMI
jgi:hypothetical protein